MLKLPQIKDKKTLNLPKNLVIVIEQKTQILRWER